MQQHQEHEQAKTEKITNDHLHEPLKGAIISVTGIKLDGKNLIHGLIQNLGGRYTNDLHLRRNTHLIASSATGDKYTAAKAFGSNTIRIVTPDWIEACSREGAWVDETPFFLNMDGSIAVTAQKNPTDPEKNHHTNCQEHHEHRILKKNAHTSSTSAIINNGIIRKEEDRNNLPNHRLTSATSHCSTTTSSSRPSYHLTSNSFTQLQQIYEQLLFQSSSSKIFSNLKFFVIHIVQQKQQSKQKSQTEEIWSSLSNKCIQILHKLIRYGLGTRYDELKEGISHFIVITDTPYMDRDVDNSLRQFALFHPHRPSIVTPEWVIASLTQGVILPTAQYPLPPPPPPRLLSTNANVATSSNVVSSSVKYKTSLSSSTCSNKKSKSNTTTTSTTRQVMEKIDGNRPTTTPHYSTTSSSNKQLTQVVDPSSTRVTHNERKSNISSVGSSSSIFSGSIFSIADLSKSRATQPPLTRTTTNNSNEVVSFDIPYIQTMIIKHGGRILSNNVVTALHNRARERHQPSKPAILCYVVVVGAIPPHCHNISRNVISADDMLALGIDDPSLLELATDSCSTTSIVKFILVTPIWVHTCVNEEVEFTPEDFPLLFQPLAWDIKCLPLSLARHDDDSTANNNEVVKVRIAVTGFVGAERQGLVQTITAMGAVYTENLKVTNTHLISKEPDGAKYKRAVKWGIYVVSVDWLYHVARYGFFGADGQQQGDAGLPLPTGCERQFSLVEPRKSPLLPQGGAVDPCVALSTAAKSNHGVRYDGNEHEALLAATLSCVENKGDVQLSYREKSPQDVNKSASAKPKDGVRCDGNEQDAPLPATLSGIENKEDDQLPYREKALQDGNASASAKPNHGVRCDGSEQDAPLAATLSCVENKGHDQLAYREKASQGGSTSDSELVDYTMHGVNALQQSCTAAVTSVLSPCNERLRASLSKIGALSTVVAFGVHPTRNRRRSRRLLIASNVSSDGNATKANDKNSTQNGGSTRCKFLDSCDLQHSEKLPSPLQDAKRKLGQEKKRLLSELGDESQVVWFSERFTPQR